MIRKIIRQGCVGEVSEVGEISQRGIGEASSDHTCLDVRVETHRDGCLDSAAHYHQVVSEQVSRPAPSMHLLAEPLLLCRRHGLNHEDLEIGPAERIVLRGAEDQLVAVVTMFALGDVVQRAHPVGLGDERAVDPSHEPSEPFPGSNGR
jgi:hypothetical protein